MRALSSGRRPGRGNERGTLKSLIVERRFAGREGLKCITKHLKGLEHLGIVVSYASEVSRAFDPLPGLFFVSVWKRDNSDN